MTPEALKRGNEITEKINRIQKRRKDIIQFHDNSTKQKEVTLNLSGTLYLVVSVRRSNNMLYAWSNELEETIRELDEEFKEL